jgi:Ca2+-binding EF-hand superfamily protein
MPVSMSGAPKGAGGYTPSPGAGAKAGAYLAKHKQQSSPPPFDYSAIGTNVNEDPLNQDMRNDTTIAAHRTAARTGTSFDMADLITHGTATKLPNVTLPEHHPSVQVIRLNEATMPGDVIGNSPRHPPGSLTVEERLAAIVRERSLDFVNLMDDFLKRPAYSRMPTRNRSFLTVPDFRRAICYALGDQWTRLAMTTAEFDKIVKQYVRMDVAHGSQQSDVTGFGQPEPLISWMPFAYEIQKLADGDGPSPYKLALRGALSKEQQALFDQAKKDAKAAEEGYAAHAGQDIGFSETSNTREALEKLQIKKQEAQREANKPMGKRGARKGEVDFAKKLICDRLLQKNATVRKALKDIDESGDGVLSRDEIKKMLQDFYLLKYYDFYTGQQRGDLDVKVVETLLDLVDTNGDGIIKYDEFADVVMAGAN